MFKRRAEPKHEGGNFIKLESGQSVTGVFRGDVLEFYQSWPKGGEKQVSLEPFEGGKLRMKANFVVHEGGKFVAKIFEFPVRVNNMLADIASEYDLNKTKIKLTRQGEGKNTNWMILPITKEPLSAKQLKEIAAVELNILGEAAHRPEAIEDAESADGEEAPF